MKPLGVDLGRLAEGDFQRTPFVQPACPGARVWVTRNDIAVMISGGEVFEREGTDVPKDGYGHARVRCGRDVERKMGCAGNVIYMGLCGSCHRVEENNRRELRERRKTNEQRRKAAG